VNVLLALTVVSGLQFARSVETEILVVDPAVPASLPGTRSLWNSSSSPLRSRLAAASGVFSSAARAMRMPEPRLGSNSRT